MKKGLVQNYYMFLSFCVLGPLPSLLCGEFLQWHQLGRSLSARAGCSQGPVPSVCPYRDQRKQRRLLTGRVVCCRSHNITIRPLPCSQGNGSHQIFCCKELMIREIHIQCVPIKRKPVLSVGYRRCHRRFNQTICFIIKGILSSFIWYQTHDDISMHDWKGTI